MKRITIKEIAGEAGVSKATVSRVLNHENIVDPQTAKRVIRVMEKYNYTPSQVARNLTAKDTNIIGFIMPQIDNPFYGKLLRKITVLLDQCGLALICCDTDNQCEKDLRSLQMLDQHRVRGVILTSSLEYGDANIRKQTAAYLNETNLPVVFLDRDLGLDGDGVFFDDYQATYEATRILQQCGHQNIAFIGGDRRLGFARERERGYREAMIGGGWKEQGLTVYEGDFTAETACMITKKMLSAEQTPSAVVTGNNETTLGFFKGLAEMGIAEDCKMEHIGVDEIDTLEHLHIRYNHIARSTEKMAEDAVRLLLERIDSPDKGAETVIIKPQFRLAEDLKKAADSLGIESTLLS